MDSGYLLAFDPFAIQFTESFGIRWYGLGYLGGFLSGYFFTAWLLAKPGMLLSRHLLEDFVFSVAVGCIVGGRLGYCLFYSPSLLTDFRDSFPFWGVLAVNEGGMASHGGIVGMVIAVLIFSRRHQISFWHLGDLVIYGSTLGITFGRLANFINGELVGRACNSSCIFPVKFPQDILTWPFYSPEKLLSLQGVVEKLGIEASSWRNMVNYGGKSQILDVMHQIVRSVQSGNKEIQEALKEVLIARHPSQLYAAFFEGLFLFLVLFWVWRKPQRPGVIAALFLFLYPIMRMFTEFFREPDLHVGFQLFGLTRGQWLSIIMLAVTSVFLIKILRSSAPKIGGWAKKPSK